MAFLEIILFFMVLFAFIIPELKARFGPWWASQQEKQQAREYQKEYREHPEHF